MDSILTLRTLRDAAACPYAYYMNDGIIARVRQRLDDTAYFPLLKVCLLNKDN